MAEDVKQPLVNIRECTRALVQSKEKKSSDEIMDPRVHYSILRYSYWVQMEILLLVSKLPVTRT